MLFDKHFNRLYKNLHTLEREKVSLPKYSYALKDLAGYYGLTASMDRIDSYVNNPLLRDTSTSSFPYRHSKHIFDIRHNSYQYFFELIL